MKIKLNLKKLAKFDDYVILLLAVGIVALVNYLFTVIPLRLDLTAQKNYSLSGETKKIVRALDDVVNIKIFLSAKLPARLKSSASEIKDAIQEYATLSRGKIKTQVIDPGDDAAAAQEAQALGIPKLQFSNIENEQFQVSQGYFGIALQYGDKTEAIPVVDTTANLEYELTSRLAKLTRKDAIKIALTSGHEEDSAYDNLKLIHQVLGQEYEVGAVEIATTSGLLDNTNSLLIVAGPKKPFTKDETYLLDQYVMQGRSVLILSGGAQVSEQLFATQFDSGLNDWLGHYNLKIQENLVMDASSEIANFSTGQSFFLVPYPFFIKVLPSGMSREHTITSALETVTLPWSSAIEIDESKDPKPTVLLSSSKQSWEQTGTFNLDPSQEYAPAEDQLKSYPLSALVEGKLTSAFDEGNQPAVFKDTAFTPATEKGKIAIVAGSSFITDNLLKQFNVNAAFFMNLVEYLASDRDLSKIRVKGDSVRPLAQIPSAAKEGMKYANIFGPGIIVALCGLVYLGKRNRKENTEKQ